MSDHYLKNELYDLIRRDDSVFEFIQASALDGMWYWDLERPEHQWMNPRFWITLGFDPATKPSRVDAWQDRINPEDLARARRNLDAHFSDPDQPYDQILRFCHRDGSTVWIRSRGLAIRRADGTPVRMLGTHTDITRFKQAELRAREDTQLYKAFVDNQSAYLLRINRHGRYTFVNDAYCEDLGWAREELLGQSSLVGVVEEDHEAARLVGEACYADPGTHHRARLRKQLASGEVYTADWEFTALTDELGEPTELLCIGFDVTQQVRAEAELQRANSLLNDAQRIAGLGAWELDVATGITRWTDEVYAIHDLPPGTPTSKLEGIAFYHPDDRALVTSSVDAAISKQQAYDIQCRLITAAGRLRWVRASGNPVMEDGRTVRLVGIIQDITESRETRNALQQSESRYRLLAEHSQDMIALQDPRDGHFIYASPAFERVLGYSQEELFALEPRSLIHPDDLPRGRDAYQRIAGGGQVVDVFRVRTRSGEYRWIETSNSLVVDDSTGEMRVLATSRDITRRREAESARAASEARFRSLVENANDLILTLHPDGTVMYVSPMWESIHGTPAEDAQGASFSQYVHPDDREMLRDALDTVIVARHATDGLVYRGHDAAGESRWFSANAAPLLDQDGAVGSILLTVRDITRDKQAEATTQATLRRLEQTLAHNRLLMREGHHRLKNNLAIIAALLNLQVRELDDPAAISALNDSRERVLAMSEMHELMYRHDTAQRIAFDQYLTSLVERMERSLSHDRRRVLFELRTESIRLSFDRAVPLALIVNELLTNASKYALPPNGAAARVTLAMSVEGDELSIVVSDNGSGLGGEGEVGQPHSDTPAGSRAAAGGGEGSDSLGMTVIRSFTNELRGTVEFENRPLPGVGLRVRLRIPVAPLGTEAISRAD